MTKYIDGMSDTAPTSDRPVAHKEEHVPLDHEVRDQLARILSSDVFSEATRLKRFLDYVVDEDLAGRGARIKATTIAQIVFDRDEKFDSQTDPVVRVEASRLRRRLTEYYATEGKVDSLIISIPKGRYIPHYKLVAPKKSRTQDADSSRERRIAQLSALGFGLLLAISTTALATWWLARPPSPSLVVSPSYTENSEANALFREIGRVSRPPHIKARVLAAIELAKEVQELDPSFGGGYAAEAFQIWHYVIFGHSEDPDNDAARALALARKSIEVDPEFSWGYQSLSRALHLLDDLDGSVAAARNAIDLEPQSAEHQGNLGIALISAGRPSEAIGPIKIAIELSGQNMRVPYLNYLGLAYFHNRQFEDAAQVIQKNRDVGGPTGPHMYAYLAAAHVMAGHHGRAIAAAQLARADPSGFPIATFLTNLIRVPAERDFLYTALEKAGLQIRSL